MNWRGAWGSFIYRNLANATSILGVLPLVILFLDDGYRYVVPLIVYNNFMDDLDGVLAAKLNTRSRFGADLDNVCDAVAHVVLALAVGAHFGSPQFLTHGRVLSRGRAEQTAGYDDPDHRSGETTWTEALPQRQRDMLFE